MAAKTHRFNVGEFNCVAVADGLFNYPVASFFSNAPQEQVKAALREQALPVEQVATPYSCLFLDTGLHKVMIDTGAGTLGAHAARFFPTVDHGTTTTGHLVQNLKLTGIDPAEIDTVVITHAHPDHVGGTLREDGELFFPDAQYYIGEHEWEFWFSEDALEKAPASFIQVARKNLEAIGSRTNLVPDEAEIVPGILAIAAPGHTPGQIALAITSNDERLLHVTDVVLHPLHLEHPAWRPAFDMDPDMADRSKRRIFDRAADEGALVFAHHFPPFPSLGHVRRHERGWRWEPIEQAK